MERVKEKVYQIVAKIPKGKVMTYGQVSKLASIDCARLVGRALHSNQDPVKVPCHRVVFADGSLSRNYGLGGYPKQKKRLVDEGISFIGDIVDLKKHLYDLG